MSEQWLSNLIRATEKTVRARAARVFSNEPHIADDITQEVWIRVARAIPKLRNVDHPEQWVLRICDRICIDEARRLRRRLILEAPLTDNVLECTVATDGPTQSEGDHLSPIERDTIANAVVRLPRWQRGIVVARWWFDMKPAQIAEAFGLRCGTVWKALSHAHASLRVALAGVAEAHGDLTGKAGQRDGSGREGGKEGRKEGRKEGGKEGLRPARNPATSG
jgi:RNA polymerase sigma factor (sigma-70 family)